MGLRFGLVHGLGPPQVWPRPGPKIILSAYASHPKTVACVLKTHHALFRVCEP